MKRPPIGSYEEARLFALERFSKLSPAKKLEWLAQTTAFIDEVNPDVRRRRLGLASARRHKGNGR